jgi:hypothetical protein
MRRLDWMGKTNTFCRLLGVILVGVGVLGFFLPRLIGVHMSFTQNLLHIMVGLTALYVGFACTLESARMYCRSFGTMFECLGILGCLAPDALARLFGYTVLASDVMVLDAASYVFMGFVMLAIGLFPRPYVWSATYYSYTIWRPREPMPSM